MRILCLLFLTISINAQNFTGENVQITNVVLQITPHPTNISKAFLKDRNGNTEVSGTVVLTAYIGQVNKLSWDSRINTAYLIEWSTNSVDWIPFPIVFVGNGQRLVYYDENVSKSYRLRSVFTIPSKVRVLNI